MYPRPRTRASGARVPSPSAVGALIWALLLFGGGLACHRHYRDVQYVPSWARPAAPPAEHAGVSLQVFDRRPPDRGGDDHRRIGWARGDFGIPKHARVRDGDAVTRSVWNATADALAQLGIGASGGSHRLVATVLELWEEVDSALRVAVHYQLLDGAGRERWAVTIESGTNTRGDQPSPLTPPVESPLQTDPYVINPFAHSLAVLAARARAHFATPEFQRALSP